MAGSKSIYCLPVLIPKADSLLQPYSKIKCNQKRTVDKLRLVKCAGKITDERLTKVGKALAIHPGIIKLDF
jgi:mRNA-degrading endonuclease toxin of MazEF toxin-antitoxin module